MQEEEQRPDGMDQCPGQVKHSNHPGCRGRRTAARRHQPQPWPALVPKPQVIHAVQQTVESSSCSKKAGPDPLPWSHDASLTTFATGATA